MESQTVFEKGWELDRLTVQNQLLRECELPVYQKLLEGKSGLRLLDVGCNDGSKTMDRFVLPQVERNTTKGWPAGRRKNTAGARRPSIPAIWRTRTSPCRWPG